MKRLDLLKKAVQLAHEQVDGSAACSDAKFRELKNINEEQAVAMLAHSILGDALSDTTDYISSIVVGG